MIQNKKTIVTVPFLTSLIYEEKGGRLGGTSLILVQTKVSDPMGPLLTIQEDWANAHIHFLAAKRQL